MRGADRSVSLGGYIVQIKHVITGLLQTRKIPSVCYFTIYLGKLKTRNKAKKIEEKNQ